ncbi:MAG: hypothetical protein ACT4OY_08315, partial [Alphaproteobacteria bacterium]
MALGNITYIAFFDKRADQVDLDDLRQFIAAVRADEPKDKEDWYAILRRMHLILDSGNFLAQQNIFRQVYASSAYEAWNRSPENDFGNFYRPTASNDSISPAGLLETAPIAYAEAFHDMVAKQQLKNRERTAAEFEDLKRFTGRVIQEKIDAGETPTPAAAVSPSPAPANHGGSGTANPNPNGNFRPALQGDPKLEGQEPEGKNPIRDLKRFWDRKAFYWKRATNAEFHFHQISRALFANFDAKKDTSLVKLFTLLDPDEATKGTPKDFNHVYKAKPKGVEDAGDAETDGDAQAEQKAEKVYDVRGHLNEIGILLERNGNTGELAEKLAKDLKRIQKVVEDIQAQPAQSRDDPIRGGTKAARMGVYRSRPHLEILNDFSQKLGARTATPAEHAAAVEALDKLNKIMHRYTIIEQSENQSMFGKPTHMQTRQNAGRTEIMWDDPLFAGIEQEYDTLLGQGVDDPAIVPLSSHYTPGFDVYTNNGWGSNGTVSDNIKFLMFAYGQRGGYSCNLQDTTAYQNMITAFNKQFLTYGEMLLKDGDLNGLLEACKWIALQYSQASAQKDGKVEDTADRGLGINTQLKGYIQEHGDKNLWPPELVDMFDSMFKTQEQLGSNNHRPLWHETWKFVRNRVLGGDAENEYHYQTKDEHADARGWFWGFGIPGMASWMKEKGAPYYKYIYPVTGVFRLAKWTPGYNAYLKPLGGFMLGLTGKVILGSDDKEKPSKRRVALGYFRKLIMLPASGLGALVITIQANKHKYFGVAASKRYLEDGTKKIYAPSSPAPRALTRTNSTAANGIVVGTIATVLSGAGAMNI